MRKIILSTCMLIGIASIANAQTWQLYSNRSNLELSDMKFYNPQTGFIFGDSAIGGVLVTGVVLKTNDGGQSWNTYTLSNSNYRISKTHVFDANTIFAVGRNGGGNDGMFIKSTDGGVTWHSPAFFQEKLFGVYFKDMNNGWIMGKDGFLQRTTDGGATWTSISLTGEDIFSMGFYNSNVGIISCGAGELYRTIDGGNTWVPVLTGVANGLLSICIKGINAWVGGEAGTIITSSDQGATWTTQTAAFPVDFNVIDFADGNNGWVAGIAGVMNKTNDAGVNWINDVTGNSFDVSGLSVPDLSGGWFCTTEGTIYRFTSTTSLNNIQASVTDVHLYPNPSADFINISSDNSLNAVIEIADISGKRLLLINLNFPSSHRINVSSMASGKYFINVRESVTGSMIHSEVLVIN